MKTKNVTVTIRFVGSLRASAKKSKFTLEFRNQVPLREVIEKITKDQPKLKRALVDPDLNDPRPNSLILINGKEIGVLEGLNTKIGDGDELTLIPIVHGG